MSRADWENVEHIIDKALELPAEQRKTFIEKRCGKNDALKREVTELLDSIFESEGWLENPGSYKEDLYSEIAGDLSDTHSRDLLIGKQVGSYTIREKIGEGGMGNVYLAERTKDEFEHRVAVKIIRSGFASENNIQRFKREQKILAGMNHPGIARLFDGGVTNEGYPYIIMEYIDGIPIDEYCRENNCSLHKKLELFSQVLEAVQHAHENLVIHRDLKPGNILITRNGDVKILDFGISKLLDDDADDLITQTGSRLLTLKYAAPEQIRQENITTSTDLYALGIVLYQLLLHKEPFDFDDLTTYQTEQVILYETPPLPSSRAESKKMAKKLTGDLDAIVMKSIRKEPEHRYRTANEFLDDLSNFQQGLPVSAHDDSFNYRFNKFLKRHKRSVTVAAAIVLIIVGLSGFYTWQISKERTQAMLEAQKAENVKNLLVELFEGNDPITGDAESVTLPQLLETGTEKILNKNLESSVKIELLLTLATIHQNITQFEKAKNLAEESLELARQHFGEHSVEAAESYIHLGGLEHDLGNYKEGKEHFLMAKQILDENSERSIPLYAKLYDHMGHAEEQLGNYEASQDYFSQALQVIEHQSEIDSSLYIRTLKNLSRGFYRNDNDQKGDSLLLLALNASKHFHGEQDVNTASILGDLGMYKMTRAEYEEARNYYNQSLEIKEAVYGEEGHPNYTATLTNLAVLEKQLKNFSVAESLFIKTMQIDEKMFGSDHPYVAMSKSHLAGIYMETGNLEKSRKFREEAMEIYLDSYGPDHYYLAAMYLNYGKLLSLQGEYEKAENYFKRSESVYKGYESTGKDNFAKLYFEWGKNDYRMNQYQSAVDHFETAADHFDDYSYDEYIINAVRSRLYAADCYIELGRTEYSNIVLQNIESRLDTSSVLANNHEIENLLSATYDKLGQKL